jgi:hypothetical protein
MLVEHNRAAQAVMDFLNQRSYESKLRTSEKMSNIKIDEQAKGLQGALLKIMQHPDDIDEAIFDARGLGCQASDVPIHTTSRRWSWSMANTSSQRFTYIYTKYSARRWWTRLWSSVDNVRRWHCGWSSFATLFSVTIQL